MSRTLPRTTRCSDRLINPRVSDGGMLTSQHHRTRGASRHPWLRLPPNRTTRVQYVARASSNAISSNALRARRRGLAAADARAADRVAAASDARASLTRCVVWAPDAPSGNRERRAAVHVRLVPREIEPFLDREVLRANASLTSKRSMSDCFSSARASAVLDRRRRADAYDRRGRRPRRPTARGARGAGGPSTSRAPGGEYEARGAVADARRVAAVTTPPSF